MEEIWKDISGCEGLYQVSNRGRVRSLDHYDNLNRFRKGKILKPCYDSKGDYLHITLKGKSTNIHRLVAKTFLPNPNNYVEVNHIDENKTNNQVENLEWCNHKYNNTFGSRKTRYKGSKNPSAKLTNEQIINIRNEYIPYSKTNNLRCLSEKYNVSQSHLSHILNGSRWGWLSL